MSDRRATMRAFTLIEVMVALAIAALALTAVTASVSQMVDAAGSMKERTFAVWIAENKITEMRLSNELPEVSETKDKVQYAGREWQLKTTVSETGVEHLFRIDVAVSAGDSEAVIRTVTGFVGEPGIPGQSNIAWMSATQAVGDDT